MNWMTFGARRAAAGRVGSPLAATLILALVGLTACTGSPATLALRPDFVMTTSLGTASVSIRQSPPGMTDATFARMVRTGMEAAMPGSAAPGPVTPPFPVHRIVWHVNPDATPGVSRLVVNVFDGPTPVAVEQARVANGAAEGTLVNSIVSLTRQLAAAYAQLGSQAPA